MFRRETLDVFEAGVYESGTEAGVGGEALEGVVHCRHIGRIDKERSGAGDAFEHRNIRADDRAADGVRLNYGHSEAFEKGDERDDVGSSVFFHYLLIGKILLVYIVCPAFFQDGFVFWRDISDDGQFTVEALQGSDGVLQVLVRGCTDMKNSERSGNGRVTGRILVFGELR